MLSGKHPLNSLNKNSHLFGCSYLVSTLGFGGVATIRESYMPFKRIYFYDLFIDTEKGFQMLLQNPSPD